MLFNLFYAAMLINAFHDTENGITVQYRTDGGCFNLRRLTAKTKITEMLARDLLYADDCALAAHSIDDAKVITNCFAKAAARFGLSINIKKTEVVRQACIGRYQASTKLNIGNETLEYVDKFCYLGSMISSDATLDDEINHRLSRASAAFGRLRHRLWDARGIKLATKIAVYRAAILSTLMYGCEAWTTYRRHVKKLDQFHMRCLRQIAGIKWQDKIPNTAVLEKCKISGIEALLMRSQLRWSGHLVRMADERLPKAVFYGQLKHGSRAQGRPKKRYKDMLKEHLKQCHIDPSTWESTALDRTAWRSACDVGCLSLKLVVLRSCKRRDGYARPKLPMYNQPAPTHAPSVAVIVLHGLD